MVVVEEEGQVMTEDMHRLDLRGPIGNYRVDEGQKGELGPWQLEGRLFGDEIPEIT